MTETNGIQPLASESKPKPGVKEDLKTLPLAEVEKQLGSSPAGLSQAEAQKRLVQYGPNEIEEKKTSAFLKFLGYFWGPIPWMIETAVILSAAARHWPDFAIILLLLLANAMVGFWEEREAGNAIAALKATLAVTARVIRDGKWTTPPARELVPGDVIRLRLGDIVPADARLLSGDPVEVDSCGIFKYVMNPPDLGNDFQKSSFDLLPVIISKTKSNVDRNRVRSSKSIPCPRGQPRNSYSMFC